MQCEHCGEDESYHIALGILEGFVIIEAYGIPIPLEPGQARDLAEHLVQAADLAEWTREIEGEE